MGRLLCMRSAFSVFRHKKEISPDIHQNNVRINVLKELKSNKALIHLIYPQVAAYNGNSWC